MGKTLIDIDDNLLDRAMSATHSTTKKEAVNKALALAVEGDREKRIRAIRAMQQMARDGLLDFSESEKDD
ncbi:type II toxin-antitoxin system VapB family antitoxin [Glycomyces arizonensis]|uniref:type II toxin-antitoxin system VapB family antitoxin n=1 Tax=Glycomyces arizonensis TaxID=256035 RepID=UPI0003F7DC23|nr:type II toxin-antitoxin system VapB family antitoxin [Glycomyces arizonensis]